MTDTTAHTTAHTTAADTATKAGAAAGGRADTGGSSAGAGSAGAPEAPSPVTEAFDTVRRTFTSGRTRPLSWRKAQLKGIERLVVEEETRLVRAMAEDFGKPGVEAWLADLVPVISEAAHARRRLDRWARPRRVWAGKANVPARAWSVPEPLGTVLIISPWNYPVNLALSPLVAAIAAGNTAVLKPSEHTPATSAALAELVPRYVDPQAFTVVEGAVDTATALLGLPFDHIFFTGSTTVGKQVMRAAADHLASVTLELGGKSPVLVAADADLEVAARRIAWGKLLNAGQTCIAPDYVLAERSVADRLVEHLVGAIAQLQGDDLRATRTRIVNDRHLSRLAGLLDGCGGTIVTGGAVDRDQRWLEPTVVVGPDPHAPLMTDEIFGPILPVLSVGSIDEAVNFVNARPKPLALYVFTSSGAIERQVMETTTSGGVCVNHIAMHYLVPELPFGGVGPSGVGAYHGRAGFDELSHHKSVLRRHAHPDLSVIYPPFDAKKERVLRWFL